MNYIIYYGPFQLPDKNAAAHRVINNAKLLKELGYETVFFGCNGDATCQIEETRFETSGFDCYEIKCNSSLEKIKEFSKIDYIKKIHNKYANVVAIIAYDLYAPALAKIKKYCQKNRIAIIADTDEWFGANGNTLIEKVIRMVDSEWRMRLLQPNVDGVIAISKFLSAYYKEKVTTVQIPPLVDKSDLKWKRDSNEVTPYLTITYSGSPGKNKDRLDLIIKHLAVIKLDYKLILNIVGITKQQFIENYPDMEGCLTNSKTEITFWGRLSHLDSINIVKQSDFFVFLRNQNKASLAGFPTKFVESISLGVPILTNKTSNIDEFFADGKTGYWIDVNDNQCFYNVLNKDIEYLKSMKTNINSDLFDYHNYIDQMQGLIKTFKK